jgi:hypothetical protein
MWYNKKQQGAIILISIIVVGAIGVAITLSLLLLGVGNSRTSFAFEQSGQAKGLANACAEEALRQIVNLSTFTGSGNFHLGQGSCDYNVTGQGGQNRIVTAEGEIGTIVRKVKVVISAVSPKIILTSWQETADF